MKRRIRLLLLLLLLLPFLAVQAQTNVYHYRRPLGVMPAPAVSGSGGWRKIVLPTALFGKASPALSDLRIMGVTAAGDTVEAPYVLKAYAGESTQKEVAFKTIATAQNAQGFYYTFEMPRAGTQPVNRIQLQTANQNFDWRVRLEGSADQWEWFTLLDDYRIVAIQEPQTAFRFTTLLFPDAHYRFLRLLIKKPSAPPQELKATLLQTTVTQGQLQPYPVAAQSRVDDRTTKQTQIELSLPSPVPVSQVKITVADSFDYWRPVVLEYVTDSFQTAGGWRYRYQTLATGTLNSIDRSAFEWPETRLHRLRITIENGDSQPLRLHAVAVAGPVYALVARFTEPANYFLVYGNPAVSRPDYDITKFPETIPRNPPLLAAGGESVLTTTLLAAKPVQQLPSAGPLFKNKAWLWGVLVVICLLLGGATLRMIQKG